MKFLLHDRLLDSTLKARVSSEYSVGSDLGNKVHELTPRF